MALKVYKPAFFPDHPERDRYFELAEFVLKIVQETFAAAAPLGDHRRVVCGPSPRSHPFNDSTSNDSEYLILITGPSSYAQFAYELGHELGHVYLGPDRTSGVVEALAQAMSLTVTRTATATPGAHFDVPSAYPSGFAASSDAALSAALARLPRAVDSAVRNAQWERVRLYLRFARADIEAARVAATQADLDLRELGAVALLSDDMPWHSFAGAALRTVPLDDSTSRRFRDDLSVDYAGLPDEARLSLRRVGQCCALGLAVLDVDPGTELQDGFVFEIDGKSVGVVECAERQYNSFAKEAGIRLREWRPPDPVT